MNEGRAGARLALVVVLLFGCGNVQHEGAPRTARSASPGAPPTAPARSAVSVRQPSRVFPGDDAYEWVARIVRLERHYGAAGRSTAIELFRATLAEAHAEVHLQPLDVEERVSRKTYRLTNIVARQNPGAARRVLVGSHWDGRLWSEEDPDRSRRDKPAAYANDGGSGTALILTLAPLTAAYRHLGIDYVLFDGEEFGRPGSSDYCQGSRYYASHLPAGPTAAEAIVLDMVGDADLDIFQEITSARNAPRLTAELWQLAADLGIESFHAAPKYTIVDDHTALQRVGIQAVLLIDYDYPYWHTNADTLDKVSPKSLQAVGQLLLSFLDGRERGPQPTGR